MLKVGISGGPHSGKTTILEELKIVVPEMITESYFVDEAAVKIIAAELEKADEDPDYEPITPDRDYSTFQPIVLAKQLELEGEIPSGIKLVISDRTLVDHVGYCRLNDMEERVPEIEDHIKAANYSFAFFCEPVGEYKQTKHRRETPEEAVAAHNAIGDAYDRSVIPTIHLPAVPVEKRLEIITHHICAAFVQR